MKIVSEVFNKVLLLKPQ